MVKITFVPCLLLSHGCLAQKECTVIPACSSLEGDCCPTAEGLMLDCCHESHVVNNGPFSFSTEGNVPTDSAHGNQVESPEDEVAFSTQEFAESASRAGPQMVQLPQQVVPTPQMVQMVAQQRLALRQHLMQQQALQLQNARQQLVKNQWEEHQPQEEQMVHGKLVEPNVSEEQPEEHQLEEEQKIHEEVTELTVSEEQNEDVSVRDFATVQQKPLKLVAGLSASVKELLSCVTAMDAAANSMELTEIDLSAMVKKEVSSCRAKTAEYIHKYTRTYAKEYTRQYLQAYRTLLFEKAKSEDGPVKNCDIAATDTRQILPGADCDAEKTILKLPAFRFN